MMSTSKHTNRNQAFTIVELLIVIVVIAILAAITAVAYNGIQDRAKASAASQALSNAAKKIKYAQAEADSTTALDCAAFSTALGATTTSCTPTVGGVTYQYTQDLGGTYCITATVGGKSYKLTGATTATVDGGCPGHSQNGVEAITNLASNPSVESNTVGWSQNWGTSATGTATRMTDGGRYGSAYFRMTYSATPSVTWGGVNFASLPVAEGQSLTASVWVRSSTAQQMRLYLRPNTYPSGTDTGGSPVNISPNTWTQLSVVLNVVPSGITSYTPFTARQQPGSWQPGNILDHDGLMITKSTTVYNYADGNSTDWAWAGALNNSTSSGPPV